MNPVPRLTLNDGHALPQFGLGTCQIPDERAASVVREAVGLGYRHLDTATIYYNERGVGEGIAGCGVPREALFVTTKLWNLDQGYDETLRAFDASLERLGLGYVDLYLIHWPCPARDRFVDSWRALIALREQGRARSIGVSNFQIPHLRRLIDDTGVTPAVNQVELHPFMQQAELRRFHESLGIVTESWSPLARGGDYLKEPLLLELAGKHGKTAAQVVLRWHVDNGLVVFPKSESPQRLAENLAIFDFRLDAEDLERMRGLERNLRTGEHPDATH